MSLAYEIRRLAKAAVAPTLLACTVAYFAYYAIHGERGLFGYFRIVDKIRQVEMALDVRRGKRASSMSPEKPRKVVYTLNLRTAEHLKLSLPPELIEGAAEVFR